MLDQDLILAKAGSTVLALLLENVGVDKVVRLGNPEIWRNAIENL